MQRKQGSWTLRLAVIGAVMLITGFFLASGTTGMLDKHFNIMDDRSEDRKKQQCRSDVRQHCEQYPEDTHWNETWTSCDRYKDVADPQGDVDCTNND